ANTLAYRPATSAGSGLTNTPEALTASATGTPGPLSRRQKRAAPPTRAANSTKRAALSGLRATTVISPTPNSANATIAAGALPPDPDTTARPDAEPSAPNAPLTPSMSVLSARQPRDVRSRVLADPTSSARSVRSSANRSAANFPGIVTETPTHSGPNPPTTPGSSSAPHSIRS